MIALNLNDKRNFKKCGDYNNSKFCYNDSGSSRSCREAVIVKSLKFIKQKL